MSHQTTGSGPTPVQALVGPADGQGVSEVLATLFYRGGEEFQCTADVEQRQFGTRHVVYRRAKRVAPPQGSAPAEPPVWPGPATVDPSSFVDGGSPCRNPH